jgi:polyferredoxin
MQHRASAATFTTIVLAQVGVRMACRSESRPALQGLGLAWIRTNPLLLLGIGSELLLTTLLITVAPLAALLEMAPFPVGWLGWMLPVPLLVVLVDDARKRLQRQRAAPHPAL